MAVEFNMQLHDALNDVDGDWNDSNDSLDRLVLQRQQRPLDTNHLSYDDDDGADRATHEDCDDVDEQSLTNLSLPDADDAGGVDDVQQRRLHDDGSTVMRMMIVYSMYCMVMSMAYKHSSMN